MILDDPERRYAVVTLSGDDCVASPGTRCILEAFGPYTGAEAREVADWLPAGMVPHFILLERDWALDAARRAGVT